MIILGNIILGPILGFLVRGLVPGDQKMGWVLTCLLGIAGSVLAGFAGQALGWCAPGQPSGGIASVIAAVALLDGVGKLRSSGS